MKPVLDSRPTASMVLALFNSIGPTFSTLSDGNNLITECSSDSFRNTTSVLQPVSASEQMTSSSLVITNPQNTSTSWWCHVRMHCWVSTSHIHIIMSDSLATRTLLSRRNFRNLNSFSSCSKLQIFLPSLILYIAILPSSNPQRRCCLLLHTSMHLILLSLSIGTISSFIVPPFQTLTFIWPLSSIST